MSNIGARTFFTFDDKDISVEILYFGVITDEVTKRKVKVAAVSEGAVCDDFEPPEDCLVAQPGDGEGDGCCLVELDEHRREASSSCSPVWSAPLRSQPQQRGNFRAYLWRG